MTQLINELFNDKAVYRTAPATPGLLNIAGQKVLKKYISVIEMEYGQRSMKTMLD